MSSRFPVTLCRLEELPEGGSARLDFPQDAYGHGLCVVRQGDALHAYLNRCPHTGAAMDWQDGQFLDLAGEEIVCSLHGARFRIEDGYCVAGPCQGQSLSPVALSCVEGEVRLEGLGRAG